MITKGLIKGKLAGTNRYNVRIPYFETAGDNVEYVVSAPVSYTPGTVNSLEEGDVVFVAFEDHFIDKPVIIGKLFVDYDVSSNRGAAKFASLDVSDSVKLPANTMVGDVNLTDFINLISRFLLN